jgi:hypothetical protein
MQINLPQQPLHELLQLNHVSNAVKQFQLSQVSSDNSCQQLDERDTSVSMFA